MRAILVFCVCLIAGCRGGAGGLVVVGSAYVEADRPEGKAVAKVEVQYRPTRPPVGDDRVVANAAHQQARETNDSKSHADVNVANAQ